MSESRVEEVRSWILQEGSEAIVHLVLLRQLVEASQATLNARDDPDVARVVGLVLDEARKLRTHDARGRLQPGP